MGRKTIKPGTFLAPTPAVMVSCKRNDEKPNIITIAWVGVINSDPPMVSISIRSDRYSYDIIKESENFVVNIPTRELCPATDYCGIVSGRDVDKFKIAELTPHSSTVVSAPSIKECPVCLECELKDVISLGTHHLFLGEIVAVTADESVLEGNKIQTSKLNTFAYTPSTNEYWTMGEALGRFGYAKKMFD